MRRTTLLGLAASLAVLVVVVVKTLPSPEGHDLTEALLDGKVTRHLRSSSKRVSDMNLKFRMKLIMSSRLRLHKSPKHETKMDWGSAPAGITVAVTIHDHVIGGKNEYYSRNGGRLETYVAELEGMARSLRKTSPGLPLSTLIDFERSEFPEHYDRVLEASDYVVHQTVPSKGKAWGSLLPLLIQTPFQHTMHIDLDTRVCDDLHEAFKYLNNFDLGMTPDLPMYSDMTPDPSQRQPTKLPDLGFLAQMQGGMLLYRANEHVLKLLMEIYDAQGEAKGGMQKYFDLLDREEGILGEHLHRRSLSFVSLPWEYNFRANTGHKYPAMVHGVVKLVHSRALIELGAKHLGGDYVLEQDRQNPLLARPLPRSNDPDLGACDVVNEVSMPRLISPNHGIVSVMGYRSFSPWVQRFSDM
mmetsp:Transcript_1806/g.6226  ORF Transcript_1806/g.6226 Transcript_1806/m.6226 type:complete len:413 (+) Transcript_1806:99-1337(+)